MRKFCDAETRNEFADFLKISRSQLSYVLFVKHPHSYYKTFEIPKKSGGTRVINAPYGELKFIQEQLNKRLAEYQKYIWEVKGVRPAISHGFEKGKSIITNAKIHRNKRYVVNLDIENFFGTFHFGRIVGFFEKNRYFRLPHEVAITIAQITCYNGTLPQGAPSSPIITNYICQVLDRRLLLLAREYRLDYTRYADDITFSTTSPSYYPVLCNLVSQLVYITNENDFYDSMFSATTQFQENIIQACGEKVFFYIQDNLDEILYTEEKIINLNNKLLNISCTDSQAARYLSLIHI